MVSLTRIVLPNDGSISVTDSSALPNPLRVVMADDHQIFLDGLARLLQSDTRIEVVGTCNDGDALKKLVQEHAPDVAIVDISMPGPGPAQILEAVDQVSPSTRTVALTMHLEPAYARELLAHGMNGYVVKEAAFDELTDALFAVSGGRPIFVKPLLTANRVTPRLQIGRRNASAPPHAA